MMDGNDIAVKLFIVSTDYRIPYFSENVPVTFGGCLLHGKNEKSHFLWVNRETRRG